MSDQIITPLPEVVDRYTICQLKLERLDHTQIDVDSMKEQLEYYKKGIDFSNTQLIELSKDLYKINGRIWDTESDIRKGIELPLEEIVRKLGHMLAIREERGDNSADYNQKKDTHDYLLRKLYRNS